MRWQKVTDLHCDCVRGCQEAPIVIGGWDDDLCVALCFSHGMTELSRMCESKTARNNAKIRYLAAALGIPRANIPYKPQTAGE